MPPSQLKVPLGSLMQHLYNIAESQMIHEAFLIEEVLKVKKLIHFQPLESKEKLLFVSHIEAHQENKRTSGGILIYRNVFNSLKVPP